MPVTFSVGSQPLLGPVITLCAWTLVMEVWLYALRLPAMAKYKSDTSPTATKESMGAKFPAYVNWPANNYNHLMEQPTQFFATVLALNFIGVSDPLTVNMAWTYVGLRIVHSLVQAIANIIMLRFFIFSLSSITLAGLTWRAASVYFGFGSAHIEL